MSETKIGAGVSRRRAEYVLATKSTERTRDGFLRSLDNSLRNLKTDHVDLMFMHAVQTEAEADAILGPGGAMEGAEAARKAGKLRFVAISGHGRPDGLLHAVKLHRFDALMTVFNYFDRFNFPTVENELLPLCTHRGTGLIAMKAFGDGYLHKSPVPAFRYALGMPVATVVAGINSDAMLKADLEMVARFKPMTDAEKEEVYRTAPELGDYVCRLCGKCRTDAFDPQAVFLLEAVFDRQMDDKRVGDSAALRAARAPAAVVCAVRGGAQGVRGAEDPRGSDEGLQQVVLPVPVRHRRGPQAENRPREALGERVHRVAERRLPRAGPSSIMGPGRTR